MIDLNAHPIAIETRLREDRARAAGRRRGRRPGPAPRPRGLRHLVARVSGRGLERAA